MQPTLRGLTHSLQYTEVIWMFLVNTLDIFLVSKKQNKTKKTPHTTFYLGMS